MPDPRAIDLSETRSEEGYFLLREHVERPFHHRADDSDGWRFCCTYRDSAPTLRDAVFELIRNAKQKVFITSFIVGDDELIELLAQTARRLLGGVYVISGLTETSLQRGLAEIADREDISQKVEAEKKRFISLTNQGVAVRGHENCHAKFLVVDDAVAWVGSANLETRAFTRVGEVGVVLNHQPSVSRLARLFARMWLTDCKYELPAFGDGYRVAVRKEFPQIRFKVADPELDGEAALVWTDDLDTPSRGDATDPRRASLLHSVQDVIDRARRRLVLASFNLNRMQENPQLVLDLVTAAVARGVKVELLVRALNDRDRHRRDAGLFHDMGVEVLADDSNHAKAAIADDQHGVLFSANFDGDHGLLAGTGIEVGTRLDGTPAMADLTAYFQHALSCATRTYTPQPTAHQLARGLSVMPPWPLDAEIGIECDWQAWLQFHQSACQRPVTWVRGKAKSIELAAGDRSFLLRPNGSSYQLLPESTPGGGDAIMRLVREAQRGGGRLQDRGVCTAVFRYTGIHSPR
ncbi:hypothetical protein Rhe02_63430 [Rhizocola hellebori]|uniref:PLD phosphodiesterase domain-containing protein n=1 Tax=Rhizocola hellebori TaxID=1392758 RepID=A0A8J3VJQ6_9ACTN|nr:phosphatidylserine/phosphatidylglycerophosphate/cardiolipin synthase family protein [Rhizocola hellebori]GIH08276.1 hypothetical protein Rhe02_63430 [Rhizocola hellebori]